MNTIISLKNFRSYGEDGADFELAPITVLTGCNSAGKSSLVKALLLLSKKTNIVTSGEISYSQDLKLTSKEMNLGGYKTVAHDNQKISMDYTIWSSDLQDMLSVERVFCASPNDVLNNGSLYQLSVKKSDGTIIFQLGPGWVDGFLPDNRYVNSIKTEFDRFYAVGCYIQAQSILRHIPDIIKDGITEKETAIKRGEEASKQLLGKLSSVGLKESDAVLLWNQFNHDTWEAVIETRIYSFCTEKRMVNLSDLTEEPEKEISKWMLDKFLECIIGKVLSPFFTQNIEYVNSASAQIARLYSSEEGNKMSVGLNLLNSRNKHYQDYGYMWRNSTCKCKIHVPGSFLNKWLRIFGIADGMELIGTAEGLGFMAYLKTGDNKRLLAD